MTYRSRIGGEPTVVGRSLVGTKGPVYCAVTPATARWTPVGAEERHG